MPQFASRKAEILSALLFSLFAVFSSTTPEVYGQAVTGELQGVVKDSTGAVIPNTEIKLRNAGTGAETSSMTNAEGGFRFPSLLPGLYNVSVTATGFKRGEFTNVQINIGTIANLEAILQAGDVAEVVQVSADQTVVETETAQLSNNISGKTITNLPVAVAGGGIDTIALLTPGVVGGVSGGFGNTNGTTIFSNGGRSRSNNFNIDGQDNNDLTVTGPSTFINNQDAVGEFQIVTNNFSAEFGQAGGSVVNIVTKGGTNEYHGTTFYFYRNRKLFDTLTNIERRTGTRKEAPPLTNQTFGYTIGGPVIKDKVLFFNSYLGQRQPSTALAQSGPNGLTPTPAGIQTLLSFPGINSNIANAIKRAAPFNNPLGNPVVQPGVASRIVPVTVGTETRQVEFAAIQRLVSNPFTENQYSARVDWNQGDRSRLFGNYLYQKQTNTFATGSLTNGFAGDVPSLSNRIGVTHILTINPRMVNEARFVYTDIDVTFGGNLLKEAAAADTDYTNFVFPAGFLGWGPATNLPQGRLNKNYQFLNNFSYTVGNHRMKAGADFRYRKSDLVFLPNVNGQYFFTADWGQFLRNDPNQVTIGYGNTAGEIRDLQHYYFFQDDWKIKQNLTLNLGVRYELFGQPINRFSNLTEVRESNAATAFFNTNLPVAERILPRARLDKDNFSPRVGFAYTPHFSDGWLNKLIGNDEMVIRGGYGIAYDLAFYNILLNMSTATPVVLLSSVTRAPGLIVPADASGPTVRQTLQQFVPFRTLDPRTLNRTTVSNDFRSPYTMQWSLGIQRQMGRHHGLEVGYVATRALQQFRTVNVNPRIDALVRDFPRLVPAGLQPVAADNPVAISRGRIFPGQGLIRERQNGAESNYHSMQVQYTGRYSSLATLVNYTLAKQTDTGTDIFNTGVGSTIAQNPFDLSGAESGRGFLDFRHNLSLSVIYNIPGFKDQRGAFGRVLGGWQVSGTYRALPGQPFTAQQTNFGSPYNDSVWANGFLGVPDGGLRPFAGNPSAQANRVALDDVTAKARFASLFTATTPASQYYLLNDLNNGRVTAVTPNDVRFITNTAEEARRRGTPFGNVGRNTLIGDDLRLANLSVFKNIKITNWFYKNSEPLTLQFRTEMFNVFNNTNLGVPNFNVDNAGRGFADLNENTGGRRTIQFGLKLLF
jgi:Carboxypeptidase regulatory-like domain